jgi:MscS family membrane protein
MFEGLGLPTWGVEVLTAAAMIVAAVFVAGLLIVILNFVKKQLAGPTTKELNSQILDAIKKPALWLLVFAALAITLHRLETRFPDGNQLLFKIIGSAIFIGIAAIVTFLLLRLVKIVTIWYARSVAARTESKIDDNLLPLAHRVVKIVIFVIAAVTILDHFQVDVKGLLAVLGVGSLAIALAAQDTISNMISGFIIMVDRPFRVGDRIVLPSGETADVYDIGIRSSKFLTFDNTLIVVPNNDLVKSKITNLSYPEEEIRVKIELGVAYGSDIDQVKTLLVKAASEHPTVLKSPEPSAFFSSFGESALNFMLVCRVATLADQWDVAENLRCRIYRDLQVAGIEIPYPRRVVYLRKDETG